jgi:hypothetical protein
MQNIKISNLKKIYNLGLKAFLVGVPSQMAGRDYLLLNFQWLTL